jgi:hypothetical protein
MEGAKMCTTFDFMFYTFMFYTWKKKDCFLLYLLLALN